jgi:hypothetical protein
MKRWAAVPANRTAIAFGLGLSIVPSATASVIDGFVVGVLLCGVFGVLVLAWRHDPLGRSQPPADDRPASGACSVTLPDIFLAAPVLSPFGIEADERLESQDSVSCGERAHLPDCSPARSRHGLDQRAPITWRSLLMPTSPRHAAPSVISAVATGIFVMTTKLAVRPLPVRN